jgi:hypothetical protein
MQLTERMGRAYIQGEVNAKVAIRVWIHFDSVCHLVIHAKANCIGADTAAYHTYIHPLVAYIRPKPSTRIGAVASNTDEHATTLKAWSDGAVTGNNTVGR